MRMMGTGSLGVPPSAGEPHPLPRRSDFPPNATSVRRGAAPWLLYPCEARLCCTRADQSDFRRTVREPIRFPVGAGPDEARYGVADTARASINQ